MMLFAVAHLLRLCDGSWAVRSTDYPGCEGRDQQIWPARERFRRALDQCVAEMLERGGRPRLYSPAEEIEPFFAAHCAVQIPAPDRMPNTFDVGLIEPVMLSTASAERLEAIRTSQEWEQMRHAG
jgi:hypothetical protein